jgi:glycosyltransferase involved in cell wall biosynthesis
MSDAGSSTRILMTSDAVGGVFSYSLLLAEALASRGVSVTLALMGPAPTEAQAAATVRVPTLRTEHMPFALEWMDDPWQDVAAAGDWLLGLAARVRPHVVHLNGYCHAGLPWGVPSIVVAHSCVASWWRAAFAEDAPARYDHYRHEVRRGLDAASAVVSPSRAMLDCLRREYGPVRRACVISNACAQPAAVENERKPFVLAAGRLWDRAKNIEALDRIATSIPWPIRVAGPSVRPGGEAQSFGGLSELGCLDEKALGSTMSHASIFASPARYEPFGLAALEAAARGCALVLGDIPSQREIWGDAAVLVSPEDDAALANALRALIDDPDRRSALAARARARSTEFSPARMATEYFTLYRGLMAQHDGRMLSSCV